MQVNLKKILEYQRVTYRFLTSGCNHINVIKTNKSIDKVQKSPETPLAKYLKGMIQVSKSTRSG